MRYNVHENQIYICLQQTTTVYKWSVCLSVCVLCLGGDDTSRAVMECTLAPLVPDSGNLEVTGTHTHM